jgi:hypothetical protein
VEDFSTRESGAKIARLFYLVRNNYLLLEKNKVCK